MSERAQAEWSHVQDDLGIVYCLGRNVGDDLHEAVATYYKTDENLATKQTLDADVFYRRLIFQGLSEERDRLAQIERPEVVERLLTRTALSGIGILINPDDLIPTDSQHRIATSWRNSQHPHAAMFRTALEIAETALAHAGVNVDELSLYGGASFGVVNTSQKVVDDVDFVFRLANRDELDNSIVELQSAYTWDEIDPFARLPKERQILKAKRWSTSQIRLTVPYPFSIDFKVGRDADQISLWESLPQGADTDRFADELHVVDDTEALCTSPALRCEDRKGNERIVLMDGYQYIGSAVEGDIIGVAGTKYRDTNVVRVTQANTDSIVPDFRNVPIV